MDDVIFAKDRAIIMYNDEIRSVASDNIYDTIEPTGHFNSRDLWIRWHYNAEDDPDIRKKYTFRSVYFVNDTLKILKSVIKEKYMIMIVKFFQLGIYFYIEFK